ncbi:MAG: carbon-nitrogen hydrolase family protein [Nocardioides sp.]|uniref:carbon-nitrogen hydrolase family protein n=1 Tax=Nocardioides sp. TaxID=35761 RepID=UPI0039E3C01E
MPRLLRLIAVQAAPEPVGDLTGFAADVRRRGPEADLLVYPELHLFGTDPGLSGPDRDALLWESAVRRDSALLGEVGALAAETGTWLLPGSICELGDDGRLYNTALLFSPDGALAAAYRKVFPWRPHEPYAIGTEFVVTDLPGLGRVGMSVCYDAWFPEVTRQLAWMGAELVLNVVKTTTDDRAQELVLARSNSIVNQVFTVSVNCSGPEGRGRSLIVGPEGDVLAESPIADADVLEVTLDLDDVTRAHRQGTEGLNRMWSQFRPNDPPVPLPIYGGRIDPATWQPRHHRTDSATDTQETHHV